MKTHRDCQSCSMPLGRDEKGGGTEADGRRSGMYCSHCYVDGKFPPPDITAAEMQARVREKMTALGFPRLICGFFTRKIPQLERWRPAG